MTTREEIEAAVEWYEKEGRGGSWFEHARTLAEWAVAERAERQRRIEAAAKEIVAYDIPPTNRKQAIIDIITRHLDGETP